MDEDYIAYVGIGLFGELSRLRLYGDSLGWTLSVMRGYESPAGQQHDGDRARRCPQIIWRGRRLCL